MQPRDCSSGKLFASSCAFKQQFGKRRATLPTLAFCYQTRSISLPGGRRFQSAPAPLPAGVPAHVLTSCWACRSLKSSGWRLLIWPASLARARQPLRTHWKPFTSTIWHADPFAKGAYSYVPAHAMNAREALAEPLKQTLYFAGEATETNGHSATVHGAIASGRRAAQQILKS